MWYIYTLFSDTSLGEIIENINICFVQYNVKKIYVTSRLFAQLIYQIVKLVQLIYITFPTSPIWTILRERSINEGGETKMVWTCQYTR